jgi:hypothetical protein
VVSGDAPLDGLSRADLVCSSAVLAFGGGRV